jgi:hypothetical protein
MGLGQVLGARYSKNEMVGVKLTMICGLWHSILFAYNSYLPQTQAAINPFFLAKSGEHTHVARRYNPVDAIDKKVGPHPKMISKCGGQLQVSQLHCASNP